LTTNVNDGEVISESLTVRASDFHPVGKTVKLRDYGTVEIAEVNYSVLPWDAVNPNWFEPAGVTNPGVSSDTHPALIPRLPVSLTEGQLDEAELAARLVLNQVHADTGEQIEIVRAPSGIVVKGIVETEQRRRDLDDRLYTLPHVTTTLSSLERMKREQAQGADDITGIKVASMQAQATPLEAYYLKHGRNIDPLSKLSHQLFDAAFAADLESKTIDDLEHRFSQSSGMSLVTSATLTDLIFTHKQNLLAALQTEEGLLAETGISTAELKTNPPNNAGSLLLLNVAERNLALTKELALGNGDGRRSAESIVAEIATSLKDLHRAVRETQVVPPTSTRLDKRK